MESKIKKANIRINKIIKKYRLEYLISLCKTNYVLFFPYTLDELKLAENDISNQIRNRLENIYKIFGKELLTIWNLPILTYEQFNNINLVEKINIFSQYSNTLCPILEKISSAIDQEIKD